MAKGMKHIVNQSCIKEMITSKSPSMQEYFDHHTNSIFSLWYKDLHHSDLTTCGKKTRVDEPLSKNILYYLSEQEMIEIEATNNKQFEIAHQSNIGLADGFYAEINVERLRRRRGPQHKQHSHIILNDFVNVYLVNDTIKFFTKEYTEQVLTKLGKRMLNIKDQTLAEGPFTPIQVSQAIHGIGTQNDTDFHNLRKSMFLNDRLYLLVEKRGYLTNLFILLEKNPRFFTIIGKNNPQWENYLETIKRQEDARADASQELVINSKTRKQQSAWKKMLASEMMNYTTHEGEVFCPFTQINAQFNNVSMLFIASHIKRFEDCNEKEAFDINNGLLLAANADALFDKHMITVNEDKTLKFSFLIDTDFQLKAKLLLNQPIFSIVLNDERMKYMEDHRRIFEEKENKRKSGFEDDDEDSIEELLAFPKIQIYDQEKAAEEIIDDTE